MHCPRRLADFGLSRLMDNDQSHISTQTFGTIPYMPPELLADGRMTRAVDVYSFGIISAHPAPWLRTHAMSVSPCRWRHKSCAGLLMTRCLCHKVSPCGNKLYEAASFTVCTLHDQ